MQHQIEYLLIGVIILVIAYVYVFIEFLRVIMTTIKKIEKILIKINQSKVENIYFDILDLNEKEFERFKKLVSRIFKIEFNFIDVCSCVGLVELSRKIDSLYFIKYGRRYNA